MGEKVGVLKHFKVPEKIPLDPVTIPWTLWRRCLLSPGYKWYSWLSLFPPRPPKGPSPTLAKFLGWGSAPAGVSRGLRTPRPRSQLAGSVRAECFLQTGCGFVGKAQDKRQLAQVHILPCKQQGKTIKLSLFNDTNYIKSGGNALIKNVPLKWYAKDSAAA